MTAGALLEVKDLRKFYPTQQGWFGRGRALVRAVDGVSFAIQSGETLGLVGESGCGKSTTGKLILRLHRSDERKHPLARADASVPFVRRRCDRCAARLQVVFQDPYSSLNPRMRSAISWPSRCELRHVVGARKCATVSRRSSHASACVADQMLNATRTSFPAASASASASRGRWRCSPQLIVCDEPVSALDVSVQAQVINLLMDLQREFRLSYLFIAHDLAVVEHISHRVAVMYLGKIVESAPKRAIFTRPQHPYTEALLSAVPVPDPTRETKHRVGRRCAEPHQPTLGLQIPYALPVRGGALQGGRADNEGGGEWAVGGVSSAPT